MPPDPLELSLLLNQLQICSAGKITLEKNVEIMPSLLKFLPAPLPPLVVGEENLVIGYGPPPTLKMLPSSLLLDRNDFQSGEINIQNIVQ